MPGSTPNRGYPFPLGTDRIDIAGDARRLAEALDADVDALAEQSGSGSSALQAEIAIRSSADQDLSNRITAEATARNNRDNDLINDYVARDNNIYNQFRADDRYYAVTMWSHNAYQNDRILLQTGYGEYVCDGYGTFVIGLPAHYPNRYYSPMCVTANTQNWLITPMGHEYREAGQFRCHARTGSGGGLQGVAVAVWWFTMGVTI